MTTAPSSLFAPLHFWVGKFPLLTDPAKIAPPFLTLMLQLRFVALLLSTYCVSTTVSDVSPESLQTESAGNLCAAWLRPHSVAALHSIRVEFADGYAMVTSCNAIRKAQD